MLTQPPSRILVINVARIGDTLLTTPVLRALARAWPRAEITFAGHPKRIEVMQYLPFLKRAVSITKHRARLLGRMGGKEFDLALIYGRDKPLVEYGLRVASSVIAFRQNDAALDAKLHAIANPADGHPGHAVKLMLMMLEPLQIPADGFHLSYHVTEQEKAWALQALDQSIGRPRIGLQVASFPTKAHRDWPIGRFVELGRRILGRYPRAHFLIFGGSEERRRTATLHAHFPNQSTAFAGKLTLRETAALMNRLDAYVGVDTGPTHIMGALHRPLVALYHPTVPSRVLGALDHPCFYPVDHPMVGRKPTERTPMADIPAQTVLEKLESALDWWRSRGESLADQAPQ